MDVNLEVNIEVPAHISLSEGKLKGYAYIKADAPFIIEEASVSLFEVVQVEGKNQEIEEKESIIGSTSLANNVEIIPDQNRKIEFTIFLHRKTQRHRIMFPSWGKFGQRIRRMYQSVDIMDSRFYLESSVKVEGVGRPQISRNEIHVEE